MADSKEYISRTEAEGSINISEDVISLLALEAIKEVEGVGGVGGSLARDGLSRKSLSRGIRISVAEENVTIDAHILVRYGSSVNEVARAVQSAVTKAVGDMTGLTVSAVNVHVAGVVFDKENR